VAEAKTAHEAKTLTPGPSILLADRDQKSLVLLRDQLKTRGFTVKAVSDGSKALEIAIMDVPDLLIVGMDLPFIPVTKFTQILRSNPRTDKTPIIFFGENEQALDEIKTVKDSFVSKPIDLRHLTAEIDRILGRIKKVEEVYSGEKEISGSLTQIPLVDLFQVLTLNRREGKLIVKKNEGEICQVFLKDGMIVNAVINETEGEKALFRSLTWKEGKFEFIPIHVKAQARITAPTGKLLMEGMRQADELGRLTHLLPDPEVNISMKAERDTLPLGLRPIIQEVLLLLEFYNRIQDIVDHCSFPDYEVYRSLHSLLRKGIIAVDAQGPSAPSREISILGPEELQGLKQQGIEWMRVILFAPLVEGAKIFLQALAGLPEFRREEGVAVELKPGTLPLGSLGQVRLNDNLTIQVTLLPTEAEFRPLWQSVSTDTIGAILLLPPEIEHHLHDLLVVREFLTQLRFGPRQEEIHILNVSEEKERVKLMMQKSQLSSSFPEAGEAVFLTPAKPASTRQIFNQLLKPKT
jgi:DNA-binding response OmpR family regulator